jgi:hypothetical protein
MLLPPLTRKLYFKYDAMKIRRKYMGEISGVFNPGIRWRRMNTSSAPVTLPPENNSRFLRDKSMGPGIFLGVVVKRMIPKLIDGFFIVASVSEIISDTSILPRQHNV